MKHILSITGGGIRGIIPCCALIALEEQSGKLTREIFEFVGGTSTGALLAACVAAGVPAKAALSVYTEQGPKVFSPTSQVLRYANLIAKGRMFDNRTLHDVVVATLGAQAPMRINDSPIGIMITAGDQLGDCWYFVRDAPTNARTTGRASLADAATASACATTYHAPWLVPGFGYYADGGTVSLADPIYQTMVEAFAGSKCYGSIDPADARVISLGTGFYQPPSMPSPPAGVLAEVSWVTSSLVGSSETLAQQAAERQWPGLIQALNPSLPESIDEADVSAIPMLLEIGQKAAAQMDWEEILR